MKNRIIFIVGLLLLILIVCATTMIGIDHNKKKEENVVASFSCEISVDNCFLDKFPLFLSK